MMTLEDAWELIRDINETAHEYSWDTWTAADDLEDSDDEDDQESAEDLREQASREQSEHFRDMYFDLDEQQQQGIKHWIDNDQDFREEFQSWFGEDEFQRTFSQSDESDGGHLD